MRAALISIFALLVPAFANSVPFINQPLIPASASPGGAAFTLTVNGTGFVAGSVVNWNGTPRATTFVSGSQLTATILSSDIGVPGTGVITVVNPTPGGGVSAPAYLTVTLSTPSITSSVSVEGGGCGGISAAGDLNGDGILDIVVGLQCNAGNSIAVFIGNGDGTFAAPVIYVLGDRFFVASLVMGDFNGDGSLDVAVGVNNSSAWEIEILAGNGDGTLQSPAIQPLPFGFDEPIYLAVADFNRDGKLDLSLGGTAVMLGNGDGTFQQVTGRQGGTGIAVGDFNGDGILDVAVPGSVITIWLGNGDGTFHQGQNYPVGASPIWAAAADFNGDDKLDLAVANFAGSSDSVSILMGNGNGTFQPQATYPTAFGPNAIAVGDFNGDGKVDLMVGATVAPTTDFFAGNGDGTFQSAVSIGASNGATIVAGDFNRDGRLDVLYGEFLLLQAPAAVLSPTSVSFGNQNVGISSATQSVTLSNTGSVPFSISAISFSGADPADFAETNNCPATVPASSSCTIGVTFTPLATGVRSGLLRIVDNAPGGSQSVAVGGTGVAPSVNLSPGRVTFLTQLVGTSSAPMAVTVTNTGTAALTVTSVTTSGAFSQTNTCGSVAVGASCTINLVFAPLEKGAQSGALTIGDNATGSPQSVALSGSATVANLSTSELNFGTSRVGKTTRPSIVTLTNDGRSGLKIRRIAIRGANASDFMESSTCPSLLLKGRSCNIKVTFTPEATGPATAVLDVFDSGGVSPESVALIGTGR